MKIINASIDVTQIDKSKLVTTNKEGKPFKDGGKYLNVTIKLWDEPDKFGNDVSITEPQTEDQRKAGDKPKYLGNGKVVYSSSGSEKTAKPKARQDATAGVTDGVNQDDLPF